MAELQPPDVPAPANVPTNAGTAAATSPGTQGMRIAPDSNANTAAAVATASSYQDNNTNDHKKIPNNSQTLGPTLAPKRQRRPNVRLGEIGDQPATLSFDHPHPHPYPHPRRLKTWSFHKDPTAAAKSSRVRPLTNLVDGGDLTSDYLEQTALESQPTILDSADRRAKSKRSAKRVRTNWRLTSNGVEEENAYDNHHHETEFRDFEPEEGSAKEQSPVDNVGMGFRRTRVSDSRDQVEEEDEDNNEIPRWAGMTSNVVGFGAMGGRESDRFLDDGVREWLIGLGLGRYAPMFQIHEVDEQVLPLLTLEDLKDMGISAVGSRRKMYASILKLPKGFS